MTRDGTGRPETGKFSTARCVEAPYRTSAGTSISPIVSFSTRVSCAFGFGSAAGSLLLFLVEAFGACFLGDLAVGTGSSAAAVSGNTRHLRASDLSVRAIVERGQANRTKAHPAAQP